MEGIFKHRYVVGTGLTILLCLLVFGAYFYGRGGGNGHIHEMTACHRIYDLLDLSLDCEKVEDSKGRISNLEAAVTDFISQSQSEKKASRVAVFYRDLSTRQWFSVNADSEFYPASLAKLPLAIAYYKVSDLELSIFDQQIPLTVSKEYSNVGQKISVDSPMEAGAPYSIRRMIEDMLVYSDNRPIGPLLGFMRPDVWKKVYADLGVRKQSDDGKEEWSVTPRVVALMFRSLYNGSYLDLGSSQELLSVMTRARYGKGLVAGVDPGVRVAHKFGEATMVEQDSTLTSVLHDCGIIYKPKNPYILCVMTEGKDFGALEKVISDISQIVYKGK